MLLLKSNEHIHFKSDKYFMQKVKSKQNHKATHMQHIIIPSKYKVYIVHFICPKSQ